MKKRDSFLAALRRGDHAALESFYEQLRGQADDQAFWRFLERQLPEQPCAELHGGVGLLRTAVAGGDFAGFLRSAPVAAVVAFLSLALLTACQPETATEVGAPAEVGAATAPAPADVATGLAPSDPGPSEPTLSAEELRPRLLEYITKAQLPASEKRRLKSVLNKTDDTALVESRTQLSELFAKEEPKEIAAALEALVLFTAKTAKTPGKGKKVKPVTRYKGVNFDNGLEPPMTTLYKGVRFPPA
jgi:hypothetical protein